MSLFPLGDEVVPQHHQHGVSQECQRDKAIPRAKAAPFRLIQSDGAFGLFQPLFNLPAAVGDPHQISELVRAGPAAR